MITRILDPSRDDLRPAIDSLRAGELVAFPTETVYGLGARAVDRDALSRVFAAKGRPADNPLIVHVADRSQLESIASDLPSTIDTWIDHFWPGALTLVVPSGRDLPEEVSAGLPTVAVRMPAHPIALELIRGAGPLAAPSANRSGRPSPTTAQHVFADLDGLIPWIVDAGPCAHGIESTVLDLTCAPPMLLRPGAVTLEALLAVDASLELHPSVESPSEVADARSPGMRYRHYSPEAEVVVVRGSEAAVQTEIELRLDASPRVGALGVGLGDQGERVVGFEDEAAMARGLFAALRRLDALQLNTIYVVATSQQQIGRALHNRLMKAASRVIDVGES